MSQTYVHTCTNCTSRNYKCNSYNFWLNKYMNSSYLGIRRIKKIGPFLQKRHIQPRGSFTYTLYTPHLDIYPHAHYTQIQSTAPNTYISHITHIYILTPHILKHIHQPYRCTILTPQIHTHYPYTWLTLHTHTCTTSLSQAHTIYTTFYHTFLLLNMYVTHSTHTHPTHT